MKQTEQVENIEKRVGYNYLVSVQSGSSKERVQIEAQGSADTHKDVLKEMKESANEVVETVKEEKEKLSND